MPTLPVPNQQAAIAEIRKNSAGKLLAYLIPPWNSWFQQFSQPGPKAINVTGVGPSTTFTANSLGTLFIRNAYVSNPADPLTFIRLTRGNTQIYIPGTSAIIPISIGDTAMWFTTFPGPPNDTVVQFLGA